MHRSSESIAALAAALAKAQLELTNPEKSLTASLPADRREGTSTGLLLSSAREPRLQYF